MQDLAGMSPATIASCVTPSKKLPQDMSLSPAAGIDSDGSDISHLVDHTDDTLLGKEDLVIMDLHTTIYIAWIYSLINKYKNIFKRGVGMAVPKSIQTRYSDGIDVNHVLKIGMIA